MPGPIIQRPIIPVPHIHIPSTGNSRTATTTSSTSLSSRESICHLQAFIFSAIIDSDRRGEYRVCDGFSAQAQGLHLSGPGLMPAVLQCITLEMEGNADVL